MRRYLPMTLPVMTIAAAAAAACGIAWLASRWPIARAPAAIVVVALMVVPAARAGRPIARAQMQRGAVDAVHTICTTVGPDGAVAVQPEGLLAITLPQAVRGFCGVPAAGVGHARHDAGERAHRRELVAHNVAAALDENLVPAGGQDPDGDRVAHRARGNEEGRLHSQSLRGAGLEAVDGRVFAVDVVPDLGFGHRLPHVGSRPGDGVGPEVDRLHRRGP
jgi:hypothetical protein